MTFIDADKLYRYNNDICQIFLIWRWNRYLCHKTGKNRNFAFDICNLNYKKQNIEVLVQKVSGYDLNLTFHKIFKEKNDKRKL